MSLIEEFVPCMITGNKLELETALGVFFALSSLPDDPNVVNRFFGSAHQSEAERAVQRAALSDRLSTSHRLLVAATRHFLESPFTKSALLAWLFAVAHSNRGRTRMRVARNTLSSDGFLLNILAVVFTLLERLVPSTGAGLARTVDFGFCTQMMRLDWDDETRLGVTNEDLQKSMRNQHHSSMAAAAERSPQSDQDDSKCSSNSYHGESNASAAADSSSSLVLQPSLSAVDMLAPVARPTSDSATLSAVSDEAPADTSIFSERQSEADRAFFVRCMPPTHSGIICDKNREKNWAVCLRSSLYWK